MSQDKIIDRVRKMLALANNAAATEGERDNAMRMAHNLLAKHNLDLADVGSTQPEEKRIEQVARMSVYPWARGIAHSIAGLFFCEYYFSRGSGKTAHHYFVGKTSNAITAQEISQYVLDSVFKELRQRFGSDTSPTARGFATGVETAIRIRCAKLRREAEEASAAPKPAAGGFVMTAEDGTATPGPAAPQAGTALVLASVYKNEQEANKAWIAEHVKDLKVAKDRTKDVGYSAHAAGVAHGNTISLHGQIGASKNNTRRLR